MEKRPHLIPSVIVAIMLLLALVPWPYGYYQLLKVAICCVSVYVAYTAYVLQEIWVVYLFIGLIVGLFNPFVSIHLSRNLWQLIDIACACVFFIIAFVLKAL